jgi:short-subunit dehydrogenase
LVKQTITTFGKIDVLINNAGISMRALFKDADIKVLKSLMDVNFWGTVYCTKYALPEI